MYDNLIITTLNNKYKYYFFTASNFYNTIIKCLYDYILPLIINTITIVSMIYYINDFTLVHYIIKKTLRFLIGE